MTLCDAPGSSHIFLGTAWESPLSLEGLIPFIREFHSETTLWALGVLISGVIASRPSRQADFGNVYIYANLAVHTSVFISESVYTFKNYEFMLIPPIPIPTTQGYCSLLPFLTCHFFFML